MLSIKLFFKLGFFLSFFFEICSSEHLNFGTAEEPRQTEYYLSADGGANISPTDELTRTQRSFWNLFNDRIFNECPNTCNDCNYKPKNGANYYPRSSLLLPFQFWQSLPLWSPLKPLFGQLNNYNMPSSGMNTFSDNGVSNFPNYKNNVPSSPESIYEIPTPLPLAQLDYQSDKKSSTKDRHNVDSNSAALENNNNDSEFSSYDALRGPDRSSEKIQQFVYQPIIYLSPPYQGKTSNQSKETMTKHTKEADERSSRLNNEMMLSEKSAESGLSSDLPRNLQEKDNILESAEYTQSVPFNKVFPHNKSDLSKNSSMPTVSAFYNFITPPSICSTMCRKNPYTASILTPNGRRLDGDLSRYPLYLENYIPLEKYPLTVSAKPSTRAAAQDSFYFNPIQLTLDDQPYRVCPELFKEYERKLNKLLT